MCLCVLCVLCVCLLVLAFELPDLIVCSLVLLVLCAVPAFGPAEEVQNLRRTSDVEYGVAERYIL